MLCDLIKATTKSLVVLAIGLFVVTVSFLPSCQNEEETIKESPASSVHADLEGYVGSLSCKSCHQKAYSDWQSSHHHKAMMEANDTTVLGNFDSVSVVLDDISYLFYKNLDDFFVYTQGANKEEEHFKIAYTFGYTPLQQYLIPFPNGKMQTLRVSWDTEKKKWFHQYPGDKISRDDWLHWTKGGQNWNTMCASCHSTNLKKNYFLTTDSFNTQWSELTVGCESCHGPGKNHMEWTQNENRTAQAQIISLKGEKDVLNQPCVQCHSRRTALTESYKPGENIHDEYRLQTIHESYYYKDGQIKEEDYVYGSFLQSKMYHEGIVCTDCHDPHSYQLKLKGNALCLQCHTTDYDTKAHHFHIEETESAQCINCHMTGATFMGNDFRRDHSFRVPRPDQSVKHDVPNACNGCHSNKTSQWAANKIISWYGSERQDHFSDLLVPGSYLDDEGKSKLIALIKGDYPRIAKTTAMDYISSQMNFEEMRNIWTSIEEQSPDFQYEFLLSFLNAPLEERRIALPYLTAENRILRIAAATLLSDLEVQKLDATVQNDWYIAQSELEAYLVYNADFPTGRLSLGDYYLRRNMLPASLEQFQIALKKDSLIPDAYTKLATIYSNQQKQIEAKAMLDLCIRKFPDNGRAYYLLSLLENEMGLKDESLAHLIKSTNLDPANFRGFYNLAIMYQTRQEIGKALDANNKALALYPESEEALYFKYLLHKDAGNTKQAKKTLQILVNLYPNTNIYKNLITTIND